MTAAINTIQDRIAYCLEHLTLAAEWFPARKLSRHKGPELLEQTESALRFRAFMIDIEGGEEGTNASDGERAWFTDTFVITIGYPDKIQLPGDTFFRGVSGMAAADKKRAYSMLARYGIFDDILAGHPAYDAAVGNLPAIGNVQNMILLGWAFNGKVSKIRFSLEYAEDDE